MHTPIKTSSHSIAARIGINLGRVSSLQGCIERRRLSATNGWEENNEIRGLACPEGIPWFGNRMRTMRDHVSPPLPETEAKSIDFWLQEYGCLKSPNLLVRYRVECESPSRLHFDNLICFHFPQHYVPATNIRKMPLTISSVRINSNSSTQQ